MINSLTQASLHENRNKMSSRRKGKPQQRKQPDSLMTKDERIQMNHGTGALINGDDFASRISPSAQLDHLCKMLLGKMEPEQDLLTCGNCQREFFLSEIIKFIQHKVSRCNKENVEPFDDAADFDSDADNDDESTRPSPVIPSRRTSISAPIAHKAASDTREKCSPRPSLSRPDNSNSSTTPSRDLAARGHVVDNGGTTRDGAGGAEQEEQLALRGGDGVDVGCNTVYTEPVLLTCVSCKSSFTSAWSLLQHAQRMHGVKLYDSEVDRTQENDAKPDRDSKTSTPPPKLQPFNSSTSPCQPSDKSRDHDHGDQRPDVARSVEANGGSGVQSAAPGLLKMHPKSPLNRSPSTSGSDVYNQSPSFQVPRQPLAPVTAFGPAGPFSRPPFSSEINHEIMDPFRRFSAFGPLAPGLEHAVTGFPFRPPRCDGSLSLADYYSKRLQQLAHPNNFLNKNLPPFISQSLSPFSHSVNSSQSLIVDAIGGKGLHSGEPKECDICHKPFPSVGYLTIHRRSHTGEKPFKCLVCNYACSYAIKLKKHMRFHGELKSLLNSMPSLPSEASTNSDGSQRSNSSTPDSKASNADDKLDNNDSIDEDELSDDAFMIKETLAEVDIRRIQDQWKQQQPRRSDEPNDEDNEDNDDEDDELSGDSLPNSRKRELDEDSSRMDGNAKDLSLSKEQRVEILSEVMEDTGFGRIKEFKEAYSEALKESVSHKDNDSGKDDDHKDKENMGDDVLPNSEPLRPNNRSSVGSTTSKSSGRTSSQADMDSPDNKKVKLEPQDGISSPQSAHPFPNAVDVYPHGPRDLFASHGLWMPHLGRRDLLNIVLPPGSEHPLFSGAHLQENGLHDTGSALNSSPKPLLFSTAPPGMSTSSPTSSLQGVPMAIRRRNDTCEFCGKVFKNCSNLTVHRRSHTGEKPYKCELCNYACAQSSKLTRHMRTHGRVGMDVFRCKFCNMPFSVASTLEKHMRRCVDKHQREASTIPTAVSPTGSMASSTASNA